MAKSKDGWRWLPDCDVQGCGWWVFDTYEYFCTLLDAKDLGSYQPNYNRTFIVTITNFTGDNSTQWRSNHRRQLKQAKRTALLRLKAYYDESLKKVNKSLEALL